MKSESASCHFEAAAKEDDVKSVKGDFFVNDKILNFRKFFKSFSASFEINRIIVLAVDHFLSTARRAIKKNEIE